MRGEITSRRLGVLIAGLPEDSALHRARNDGHTWTTLHAMVWWCVGELVHNNGFWRGYLKAKNDRFKWPATPWAKKDGEKKWGRVAPEDRLAAAEYLQSLAPQYDE